MSMPAAKSDQHSSKQNPQIKSINLLFLLSFIFITGCVASSSEAPQTAKPYYHKVAATTLNSQQHYTIPRRYTGVVKAQQSADLGFELIGKVIKLYADEGEQVTAGTVLAELDTQLLQRERDQLHAQIKETEAQLTLTQKTLQRINSLKAKGYASSQQKDELISQSDALKATLERLDVALAANQTRLDKSRLIAPFTGVISRRFIDTGVIVTNGAPVLRLLETTAMEARIGLPVAKLDEITIDQIVALEIADQPLNGKVIAIGSDVDATTRTVTTRIALSQPPQYVVDGTLIDLLLTETVAAQGFWVPMTALSDGIRGLWNVYLLEPVPVAEPVTKTNLYQIATRDVQIEYTDSENAYVTGISAANIAIVEAGLQRLVPGQIVRWSQDSTRS